jgi:hypothetical protein
MDVITQIDADRALKFGYLPGIMSIRWNKATPISNFAYRSDL